MKTTYEQVSKILTPLIVSGTITKEQILNIIKLVMIQDNDKRELLRGLRLANKTVSSWQDYSVGTPYDTVQNILKKFPVQTDEEMQREHVEGDVNTFGEGEE